MGIADDEYASANYGDAGPTQEVHFFIKEQQPKNGHDGVGEGRSRLNITVIRPSQNQHVGDKKGQQASDTQPNIAGRENPDQNMKEFLWLPILRGADAFHPLAEQYIAKGSKKNDEQKEKI